MKPRSAPRPGLLLVTPPLVQLGTPYPATAYLSGFLERRGVPVAQADAGLDWILELLSPAGLAELTAALGECSARIRARPPVRHFLRHAAAIRSQMPVVLAELQGKGGGLSHRIAARALLIEGPRFGALDGEQLDWAFGSLGIADRARYLATLFVEDVIDAIAAGVDDQVSLARYGEAIAASQPDFAPLRAAAEDDRPLTAQALARVTERLLDQHQPGIVGMTLPFPGTVLGALRMARTIRRRDPAVKIVWGGGYVNTELRSLSDPAVFDFVDAITFDDGEMPLLALYEYWQGRAGEDALLRTRMRRLGQVQLRTSKRAEAPPAETAAPTYRGLRLGEYLGGFDMLNPMQRLWSDSRWLKLTVAHGCYWKKCTFCDLSLDYISRYAPLAATALVDRIEALIAETGERGFHFVDEAAPPAALAALARELIRRRVEIAWWGNIRFETAFDRASCNLLARSGCIAVTGGLEVASDRLLKHMQKGVTVAQVARVAKAFADAGIRVHAYLMYGFPTQTLVETVDSLEMVRQLFANGCLDSAYWHRFSVTAHSPIGQNPDAYGVSVDTMAAATFARNDLPFEDPTGCDHAALAPGLQKALYNYMHGLGFETDVRTWFQPLIVPRPKVEASYVARALRRGGRRRG